MWLLSAVAYCLVLFAGVAMVAALGSPVEGINLYDFEEDARYFNKYGTQVNKWFRFL